jgi:hypothetical protein
MCDSGQCTYVDSPNIMPGWMCGKCRVYNDISREYCKHCRIQRCTTLLSDLQTGRYYVNRLHNQPLARNTITKQKIIEWREKLTEIRRQLGPYTKCARNGPSTAIEQAEIARRNVEIVEVLLDILESMQAEKP